MRVCGCVTQVIASDQGSPQFTGTATVLVHIRDSNNKAPYFPSTVKREIVNESKD